MELARRQHGITTVTLDDSPIQTIVAQALVTAINSYGKWTGYIDQVIQGYADRLFHRQAERRQPLEDGDVVIAKRRTRTHGGAADDVIFVVDDCEQPLSALIAETLAVAEEGNYQSLVIPAIRCGKATGNFENTKFEAVTSLCDGILNFLRADEKRQVRHVTICVLDTDLQRIVLQHPLFTGRA